jgi:alpha-ribazole phosphatase/probable phosphoglycerate mutase
VTHGDTLIDLLRHGEVQGRGKLHGSSDTMLTTNGTAQMRRALGSKQPWQNIISSPLRRCQMFAESLSQMQNIPVQIDPRWKEIDFGPWEGMKVKQIPPDFFLDPFNQLPPGAENPLTFQQRVSAAFCDLSDTYSGKHLLIVTHGGPIRMVLGEVLKIPLNALVRLEVPYACLTRIRVPAGDWPPSLVFHAGMQE